MNIITIEHNTFYELRVKGLVEASTPGNRIYERGEKPSCFVYFTTPNDDEPPFELLEIIGKATDPNKILTKEVFVKYIAGAFFAHQPLFVAFDDKDSHRFQVAAVLPTLKPIANETDEAEAREQLFYPLP